MPIYLLGTLDTKGAECNFVRERLLGDGQTVTVMDTGCLGDPSCSADISRDEVFAAAGESLTELRTRNDRGDAVTKSAEGAAKLVHAAHARGDLTGIIALGGSAGTTIGTTAMRALPLGVPKVMVSTLASGQVRHYVGDKDIMMMNSVVDIAGINRISRPILVNAAAAIAGMCRIGEPNRSTNDRPLIAASMFGVTTRCVECARTVLEDAGFEVLVFHATGTGGQAMESLIDEGLIAGVLDITTTELADELVGGVLSAGSTRLTAAGRAGIPQIISVGATDMVNFGPLASVPASFQGRQFYEHNATVTLMRTTAQECSQIGEEIAGKAAAARGLTAILLPLRGVSAIDIEGQPFCDPTARRALYDAIRRHAVGVERIELDCHINDEMFAKTAANKLLDFIRADHPAERP